MADYFAPRSACDVEAPKRTVVDRPMLDAAAVQQMIMHFIRFRGN
jgi:hypothetical protein